MYSVVNSGKKKIISRAVNLQSLLIKLSKIIKNVLSRSARERQMLYSSLHLSDIFYYQNYTCIAINKIEQENIIQRLFKQALLNIPEKYFFIREQKIMNVTTSMNTK